MYGIWRKICTSKPNENGIMTKGKKQYIGQVNNTDKANWIYEGLVGEPDIAIANKYNQADVWYGYNQLKQAMPKVHVIKDPKEFTHKYIDDFRAINSKYSE